MLIDSHCHIDKENFDEDRQEMLERARAAGVTKFVVVAASDTIEGIKSTVAFASARTDCYATVGVHPHNAQCVTEQWWPALRALASEDSVIALGEAGLDHYYDHSDRTSQRQVFAEHLRLAVELQLPLVCHIRDAHDEAIELIQAQSHIPRLLIHCFTGSKRDAQRYLDLGAFISFSGIVTFAKTLLGVAKEVPLNRMLVETDCPYLAPTPHRGKRNEPAYLVETAKIIADSRGISLEDLAQTTREATSACFGHDFGQTN